MKIANVNLCGSVVVLYDAITGQDLRCFRVTRDLAIKISMWALPRGYSVPQIQPDGRIALGGMTPEQARSATL